MADLEFDFPAAPFQDGGATSDDERLAMDLESILSVLDEDRDPSEVCHVNFHYSLLDSQI